MPFRIPDAIKSFTWELSASGQPVAHVITLGGVRYVEVCPCCSCIHQLPVTHQGNTFEPRCLWREWGRPDYRKWIEQHPDAANHRMVMLTNVDISDLRKPEILSAENLTKPDIQPKAQKAKRQRRQAA